MAEIAFEGNLNDTPASMRRFIKGMVPAFEAGAGEEVVIDLRAVRYFGPDVCATLVALQRRCQSLRIPLQVRFPSSPPKLRAYIGFSGLASLFEGTPSTSPEHPENETIPYEVFERVRIQQADAIVQLIERHQVLRSDDDDALRSAIREVMQNVEDHSKSPVGGVFAARYFSAQREVRVAIVDLGVGIPSTVPRAGGEPAAGAVRRTLLQGGVTSNTTGRNAGQGLYWLAAHANRMRGEVAIFSDDLECVLRNKQLDMRAVDPPFHGTAVFFTLALGSSVDE